MLQSAVFNTLLPSSLVPSYPTMPLRIHPLSPGRFLWGVPRQDPSFRQCVVGRCRSGVSLIARSGVPPHCHSAILFYPSAQSIDLPHLPLAMSVPISSTLPAPRELACILREVWRHLQRSPLFGRRQNGLVWSRPPFLWWRQALLLV